MNQTLYRLFLVSIIIQVALAIFFLLAAFAPSIGIATLAENGMKLLAAQSQDQCASSGSWTSLIAAQNQTLKTIADSFGTAAVLLLACAVVESIVLLRLRHYVDSTH